MTTVQLNQPVPEFELPGTNNILFHPSDYRGKPIVLYFYPKDNTPGCTTEGQLFRDHFAEFDALDTVIFGISRDSIRVHENFKKKHGFPFELLSDTEEIACRLFDVLHLKKNYGREYMGIVRSTFLIDKEGILRQEWRKVKVKEHISDVLAAVKAL